VSAADQTARLFDAQGGRKYLADREMRRFLDAAARADSATKALCRVLAFTGCRISEALAVTPSRLDPDTGRIIIRTLKRRRTTFRAVPIPPELATELRRLAKGKAADDRLWSWCRQTAWRRVKAVMEDAGISGPQATPKGLRHGFGIANAEQNVPPGLTQRWMGHARLETTAIYQHAVGSEERRFAKRLWRRMT
jgi:integrase